MLDDAAVLVPVIGGVEDHLNAIDLPVDAGAVLEVGRERGAEAPGTRNDSYHGGE